MAEREYTVIVKDKDDLSAIETELTASTGAGPIPERSVSVANPRPGSRIQTHFMLTDDEAEALRSDARIRAVEIPPEHRDDIKIEIRASQTGNFYRGFNDTSDVNWGLRRINETTNVYGNSPVTAGNYEYAMDGTGVDIVIQDSGIEPAHPEWEDNDGNSRLQQIDWYTESGLVGTQSLNHYRDRDGHGTHCAGIAAGKTYGFAKGAHIYSQKLSGLETTTGSDGTGIPISDAFDAIRLWHNAKTNGRPTVVNMSWGYVSTVTSSPTGGTYRGTPWTFTTQTNTQLWDDYGIVPTFSVGGIPTRFLPAQVVAIDAEIDDMIAAGIHICIAAGNDYYKADITTGTDYDNFATYSGIDRYYHRPSSPYSADAFIVGNLDSDTFNDAGTEKDRTAGSSKKGPAVNIWAPGTNIMSTSSTQADVSSYTLYNYPEDANYDIMSISGTSMASPQVAGVCALYLQAKNLTPAQLLTKIIADSKSVIYETGNDNDYSAYTTSIMGSANRHLYSRYGRQPLTMTNINTSIG